MFSEVWDRVIQAFKDIEVGVMSTKRIIMTMNLCVWAECISHGDLPFTCLVKLRGFS